VPSNGRFLVQGRQDCTNESYQRAWCEIQQIEVSAPPIPVANPTQAEFEAQLLDRIGYGSSTQDVRTAIQHPFGIRSIVPAVDKLEIALQPDPEVLQHFVTKVSHYVGDRSNVTGIPGLRVTFKNDRAELRRLHADGLIVLRGVTEAAWNSAFLKFYDDIDSVKAEYTFAARSLHPAERDVLVNFPWNGGPHGSRMSAVNFLLSGILRRIYAFRARSRLRFVDLWFDLFHDGARINIEWAGDLPHFDLARRLTNRTFGLPVEISDRQDCYCEPCMGSTYSLDLRDTFGSNVEIALRRSGLYDEELPKRDSGLCWRPSERSDGGR
jgi:hypothetical protein